MTYSGARIAALVVYTVMVVVLGLVIAVYSRTWAYVFIVIFLAVGIPVMLLQQRWARREEASTGGEFPMPTGGDGLMERDIAEGRWGDETAEEREEDPL
jgi:low affinity Fe/Cu permease